MEYLWFGQTSLNVSMPALRVPSRGKGTDQTRREGATSISNDDNDIYERVRKLCTLSSNQAVFTLRHTSSTLRSPLCFGLHARGRRTSRKLERSYLQNGVDKFVVVAEKEVLTDCSVSSNISIYLLRSRCLVRVR